MKIFLLCVFQHQHLAFNPLCSYHDTFQIPLSPPQLIVFGLHLFCYMLPCIEYISFNYHPSISASWIKCAVVSCHFFPFKPAYIHFFKFKFCIVGVYYLWHLKLKIGYALCHFTHTKYFPDTNSLSFEVFRHPIILSFSLTSFLFNGMRIAPYNAPLKFGMILNISWFCKIILSLKSPITKFYHFFHLLFLIHPYGYFSSPGLHCLGYYFINFPPYISVFIFLLLCLTRVANLLCELVINPAKSVSLPKKQWETSNS